MNKNEKLLFNSHLTLTGFEQSRVLNIISGDKTRLEFTLKDKNNTPIELGETTGQAQIVDSRGDALVAIFDVEVSGSQASFTLDKALPALDYELYLKVGNYYFPSREDSFVLRVIEAYDVVSDIDVGSVQTIDIVVDALRADVIEAIKPEVGGYVSQIIDSEPERFKGEKGDKFTIHDFTEEEWASLKGEDGNSLTFDQLDTDQQEALRGHSAYQVAVNEGFEGSPEEWFATFKGDKGDTGDSAYEEARKNGFEGSEAEWLESLNGLDGEDGQDGKSFDYESLTPEQIAELQEGLSVRPPKIYTASEYYALDSYDPHTLYFVIEEGGIPQ